MIFSKKNIFVLILLLACVTILLWPIIFNEQIILQVWATEESYPLNAYFDNYFEDHLPLWFSSYSHGFPAYLSQGGGFLHPIILILFRITNYLTAYHCLIFFNLFVSSIATYALARRIGMSRKAGIISAATFSFSQMSMFTHAITILGNMIVFLPGLLLCVFELHRSRIPSSTDVLTKNKSKLISWLKRRKRICLIVLTAVLLSVAWLTSYTEGVLQITITVFLFAFFLDIIFYLKNKQQVSIKKCFSTAGAMIVVIFSSILIASPWILPVINFIGETRRGLPGGESAALSWNSVQLNELFCLFHPYFFIPYIEYLPFVDDGTLKGYTYVGILPLFLGIVGFLNARKNKTNLFFVIFFLFTLLTYLPYIPLNWLIHKLPPFSMFRDYYKWIYVMIFCWAMLAGFGFDTLSKIYKTRKLKRILKFFRNLFFLVFGLGILANMIFFFFKDKIILFGQTYFDTMVSKDIALKDAAVGTDIGYVYGLISESVEMVKMNIAFLNPHFFWAMFFVFSSALIILFLEREWLSLPKFKIITVILIILNFTILWQGFYNTAPNSLILKPPATVEFLNSVKKEKEPYRVTKFPNFSRYNLDWGIDILDNVSRYEIDIALLTPNYSLLFDIGTIFEGGGFRPLRHERMASYTIGGLQAGIETGLANEGFGYRMANKDRIEVLNSSFSRNLLSMMNVKYILTTLEIPYPWVLVYETKVTKHEIPVYIYENPEVMNRVYFAKDVKFTTSDINIAFDELKKIEDFNEMTLIECDNTLCPMATPQNISSEDILEIEKLDFDYLKLKIKTKTPRWLVYSQANLPTWEVKIDGKLTDIFTANYIYQGIFIPSGEHEIEFKYPGFIKQFYYSIKNLINKFF